MTDRQPLEKLPLNIRKDIRDKYETPAPELQAKIAALIGVPSFNFAVNVNYLYAYADDRYPKEHPGTTFLSYFTAVHAAIEKYTDGGKNQEAVDVLKKVIFKNEATIAPSEAVTFAGCEIKDGVVRCLFGISYLGSNMRDTCNDFAKKVDIALDSLGGDELPVVTRRSIRDNLEPAVEALKPRLDKLFGQAIPIKYDVKAVLDYLKAHDSEIDKNFLRDPNLQIPKVLVSYFNSAVDTLEKKKFGSDDMLKEAFLESAANGISFQVVDKLQHNTFNDCIFEDNEFKLQTTAKYFASNAGDIAKNVTDRL